MIIGVLLPLPFNEPFDYESEEELPLGTMVRVPFGREEQIGVVWRHGKSSGLDDKRIRTVIENLIFRRLRKNCAGWWNLPPLTTARRSGWYLKW